MRAIACNNLANYDMALTPLIPLLVHASYICTAIEVRFDDLSMIYIGRGLLPTAKDKQ